jgi:hypothetical protein
LLKRDRDFRETLARFLRKKTSLFLFLSIAVASIAIYPFVIPHLFHPSMIYHIIIHIISFDVALFLTTISFVAFKKTKSKKILLTGISFGYMLFVEFLNLLQSTNLLGTFYIPLIEVEIQQKLLLMMIILFATAV